MLHIQVGFRFQFGGVFTSGSRGVKDTVLLCHRAPGGGPDPEGGRHRSGPCLLIPLSEDKRILTGS